MLLKRKTKMLILVALFTALTSIGSYIKIPLPFSPVPLSLQTFFVLLAGLLLGAKGGVFSQILYLLLGLCGVPVFTGGGGLMYVLNPSFGYIIGFIFCAWFVGFLSQKFLTHAAPIWKYILITLVGCVICYFFGILYFYLISKFYINSSVKISGILISGFLVFLPGDILKIITSSYVAKKVLRQIDNR